MGQQVGQSINVTPTTYLNSCLQKHKNLIFQIEAALGSVIVYIRLGETIHFCVPSSTFQFI